MDRLYLPPDWFENHNNYDNRNRRTLSLNNNAAITERYELEELLRAVHLRLSEVEDRLQILEKTKNESKIHTGSQEKQITPSFETLFFWTKMLEKKLTSYSKKISIETEFSPRVRIIRKKIRILTTRNFSSFHS